jgi:type I restriction enzyme S subunit
VKYPAYPNYKESGVEWLGNVPEHWETVRLGYFARLQGGYAFRTDDFSLAGIPVVRMNNLKEGHLELDDAVKIPKELASATFELHELDLLVGMSGSIKNYAVVKKRDIPCQLNQRVGRFKVHNRTNLDSKFIKYIIISPIFRAQVEIDARGTAQLNISSEQVENVLMALPPLSEQAFIVDFLDCETGRIDALIARQYRLIELLQDKRQSIISHAVTRGLNPEAPTKDSGIEWLGEIPGHWEVLRNKTIFREVDDRSITGHEELLSVSHLTGVTPRAEKTVYMFKAETLEGYKKCERGDLIINTMWAYMGALGSTEYEGVVSPSYNVYRLRKKGLVNPKYLDYLYRIPTHIGEITRYSKGVWESRLRLYPDSFLSMHSPLPPRQEQDKIVGFLDSLLLHLNELKGRCKSAIELLQEHSTALISAAVTGKIDVRESAD